MKSFISTTIGMFCLVGFLLIFGSIKEWIDPSGERVKLEEGYWGGYFETATGENWFVARFDKMGREHRLTLIPAEGPTQTFNVRREQADAWTYLDMKSTDDLSSIEAKVPLRGRRYMLNHLINGNFTSFWKPFDFMSIRGELARSNFSTWIGMQEMNEDSTTRFWNEFVRPNSPLQRGQIATVFSRVTDGLSIAHPNTSDAIQIRR